MKNESVIDLLNATSIQDILKNIKCGEKKDCQFFCLFFKEQSKSVFVVVGMSVNVHLCNCMLCYVYCYTLLWGLLGGVIRGEHGHCSPLCVSP